jgi:hypothetical protein
MVATKSRFPTVRYALVVCLYDDFGTPAYVTPKAEASFLNHILTGASEQMVA